MEEIRDFKPYRRLLLDNKNRPIDKYSTIDEPGVAEYYFDEVHIMNQASLQVRDTNASIKMDIRQLVGDRSGLLHIHQNQHLTAEYKPGVRQAFLSGINLIIDYNGEILLPGISYAYGKGINMLDKYPEKRSIQVFGTLTGVLDIILAFETLLYLGPQARTASLNTDGTTSKQTEGHTQFGTMDLRGLSTLNMAPNVPLLGLFSTVDVRYKATISAESVHVVVRTLNIEAGASLVTSAIDRPLDNLDNLKGQGTSHNSYPTGAGHASRGGGFYDSDNNILEVSGDYYGSLYKPTTRGSAGGIGSDGTHTYAGGKGGGIINLSVSSHLLVDGTMSSDGSHGSHSGGGSGGTIFVESYNLEGHGLFSVKGGDGVTGGSGGRVSINLNSQTNYHGTYNSNGGSGGTGYMRDGGPGSVYIKDLRFKRPWEEMYLDNNGRIWDHYLILDEPGKSEYFFNVVHMYKNVSLALKEDNSTTKTLTIDKVYGDKSGRIHLKTSQVCYLEQYQSLTKTAVNLWVDSGAKIYLSQLVYIIGQGEIAFRWYGEIIGVQHMRIVPGRVINIGPTAQTSFVRDGKYESGIPGWFLFGSLELGSGATIELPAFMPLKLTVALLVSRHVHGKCNVRKFLFESFWWF